MPGAMPTGRLAKRPTPREATALVSAVLVTTSLMGRPARGGQCVEERHPGVHVVPLLCPQAVHLTDLLRRE